MQVLLAGLDADMQRFVKGPADASGLLAFGDSKSATEIPPTELADYTLTANVILNLDEFVTRE